MTVRFRLFVGTVALMPLFACSAEATDQPASQIEPSAAAASFPQVAMLPERTLDCDLGHIINFDPTRDQTMDDLRFDAMHDFKLVLPSIPIRTAPPPDPIEAAERVDPRTRIVSDPDNIGRQPQPGFVRVVDYWPDRVELGGEVSGDTLNVIVVSGYNSDTGTADMFLTQANELSNMDRQHMYQGICQVTIK